MASVRPPEPGLHISPFELFRRQREGAPPLLYDLRPGAQQITLAGSLPAPRDLGELPVDRELVLFDEDGDGATSRARELRAQGCDQVRALYGGLRLYELALDPEVVGEERYIRRSPRDRAPG